MLLPAAEDERPARLWSLVSGADVTGPDGRLGEVGDDPAEHERGDDEAAALATQTATVGVQSLGSNASRSPSPKRLNPNTAMLIRIAG